ncbi:uncharacterized protein LOC143027584 [Oratosquilla oratoria]|uniref:uncharacterized protein LOC143027584 n=1 Tax=Oratosquilla oratoria TaxID=337810 RepID=UPI003F77766C
MSEKDHDVEKEYFESVTDDEEDSDGSSVSYSKGNSVSLQSHEDEGIKSKGSFSGSETSVYHDRSIGETISQAYQRTKSSIASDDTLGSNHRKHSLDKSLTQSEYLHETSFSSEPGTEDGDEANISVVSIDPAVWKKFKFLSNILKETRHNLNELDTLVWGSQRCSATSHAYQISAHSPDLTTSLAATSPSRTTVCEPKTDEAKLNEILHLLHQLANTLSSYEQHPVLAQSIPQGSSGDVSKTSGGQQMTGTPIPSTSGVFETRTRNPDKCVEGDLEGKEKQICPLSKYSINVFRNKSSPVPTQPNSANLAGNSAPLITSYMDPKSEMRLKESLQSPRKEHFDLQPMIPLQSMGRPYKVIHTDAPQNEGLPETGEHVSDEQRNHALSRQTGTLRMNIDNIIQRKQLLDGKLQYLIAHRQLESGHRESKETKMEARNRVSSSSIDETDDNHKYQRKSGSHIIKKKNVGCNKIKNKSMKHDYKEETDDSCRSSSRSKQFSKNNEVKSRVYSRRKSSKYIRSGEINESSDDSKRRSGKVTRNEEIRNCRKSRHYESGDTDDESSEYKVKRRSKERSKSDAKTRRDRVPKQSEMNQTEGTRYFHRENKRNVERNLMNTRDTYLSMVSEEQEEFPSLQLVSLENEEQISDLKNEEAELPGLGDSGLSSEINSLNATIQELVRENQQLHSFLHGMASESLAKVDQHKMELESKMNKLLQVNAELKMETEKENKLDGKSGDLFPLDELCDQISDHVDKNKCTSECKKTVDQKEKIQKSEEDGRNKSFPEDGKYSEKERRLQKHLSGSGTEKQPELESPPMSLVDENLGKEGQLEHPSNLSLSTNLRLEDLETKVNELIEQNQNLQRQLIEEKRKNVHEGITRNKEVKKDIHSECHLDVEEKNLEQSNPIKLRHLTNVLDTSSELQKTSATLASPQPLTTRIDDSLFSHGAKNIGDLVPSNSDMTTEEAEKDPTSLQYVQTTDLYGLYTIPEASHSTHTHSIESTSLETAYTSNPASQHGQPCSSAEPVHSANVYSVATSLESTERTKASHPGNMNSFMDGHPLYQTKAVQTNNTVDACTNTESTVDTCATTSEMHIAINTDTLTPSTSRCQPSSQTCVMVHSHEMHGFQSHQPRCTCHCNVHSTVQEHPQNTGICVHHSGRQPVETSLRMSSRCSLPVVAPAMSDTAEFIPITSDYVHVASDPACVNSEPIPNASQVPLVNSVPRLVPPDPTLLSSEPVHISSGQMHTALDPVPIVSESMLPTGVQQTPPVPCVVKAPQLPTPNSPFMSTTEKVQAEVQTDVNTKEFSEVLTNNRLLVESKQDLETKVMELVEENKKLMRKLNELHNIKSKDSCSSEDESEESNQLLHDSSPHSSPTKRGSSNVDVMHDTGTRKACDPMKDGEIKGGKIVTLKNFKKHSRDKADGSSRSKRKLETQEHVYDFDLNTPQHTIRNTLSVSYSPQRSPQRSFEQVNELANSRTPSTARVVDAQEEMPKQQDSTPQGTVGAEGWMSRGKRMADSDERLEMWQQSLERADKDKEELKGRIAVLLQENHQLAERLEETVAVTRYLGGQLQECQENLMREKMVKDQLSSKLKKQQEDLDESCLSLTESLSEAQERNKHRIQNLQLSSLQDQVEMLKVELAEKTKEIQSLEELSKENLAKLKDYQSKITCMNQDKTKSEEVLATEQREKKKVEQLVEKYQKEVETLKTQLQQLSTSQFSSPKAGEQSTKRESNNGRRESSELLLKETVNWLRNQLRKEQMQVKLLELADQEKVGKLMTLQQQVRQLVESLDILQTKYGKLQAAYKMKRAEKENSQEKFLLHSTSVEQLIKTTSQLEESYLAMLSSLGENIEIVVEIVTSHVFLSPCMVHPTPSLANQPEAWYAAQQQRLRWLQDQLRRLCLHGWKYSQLPQTSVEPSNPSSTNKGLYETRKKGRGGLQWHSQPTTPVRQKTNCLSDLSIIDQSDSSKSTPLKSSSFANSPVKSQKSSTSDQSRQVRETVEPEPSSSAIQISSSKKPKLLSHESKFMGKYRSTDQPTNSSQSRMESLRNNNSKLLSEAEWKVVEQQHSLTIAKCQQYRTVLSALNQDIQSHSMSCSLPSSLITTPEKFSSLASVSEAVPVKKNGNKNCVSKKTIEENEDIDEKDVDTKISEEVDEEEKDIDTVEDIVMEGDVLTVLLNESK